MFQQKKNLKHGTRIIFRNYSYLLDGAKGTVVGVASFLSPGAYIVALDETMKTELELMPEFSSVVAPEGCLELVE